MSYTLTYKTGFNDEFWLMSWCDKGKASKYLKERLIKIKWHISCSPNSTTGEGTRLRLRFIREKKGI